MSSKATGQSKFSSIVPRKPELSEVQKSETPDIQHRESPDTQKFESPNKRMGRPPGKKSDPNYRQVTVYLPVDLHEQGRELAFKTRGEFSQIVEEALREYFRTSESPKV